MSYVHGISDPELLDEEQTSALTTIKVKTLQNWRCAGTGIPYVKLGGKVAYLKSDVLEYIAKHRRVPSVRASSRIAHDTY